MLETLSPKEHSDVAQTDSAVTKQDTFGLLIQQTKKQLIRVISKFGGANYSALGRRVEPGQSANRRCLGEKCRIVIYETCRQT